MKKAEKDIILVVIVAYLVTVCVLAGLFFDC